MLYQRGRGGCCWDQKVEVPSVNVGAIIFTGPTSAIRFTCLRVVDNDRTPRQSERSPSKEGLVHVAPRKIKLNLWQLFAGDWALASLEGFVLWTCRKSQSAWTHKVPHVVALMCSEKDTKLRLFVFQESLVAWSCQRHKKLHSSLNRFLNSYSYYICSGYIGHLILEILKTLFLS